MFELILAFVSGVVFATEAYTSWYLVNAVVWTSFWAITFLLITVFMPTTLLDDPREGRALKVVFQFLAALAMAVCVANLVAPEGYAVHALLRDTIG